MARKNKEISLVDFSANYLVKMSRLEDHENDEHYVKCTVDHESRISELVIYAEGYRTKRMYDNYFLYLLATGHIIKIENNS